MSGPLSRSGQQPAVKPLAPSASSSKRSAVNAGGDAAHAEHAFVLPEDAPVQQPYVASQGLHPHDFSRPYTPPGGMAAFPDELWLPPIDPPRELPHRYDDISKGVLTGIDHFVDSVGKNTKAAGANAKMLVGYIQREAKHGSWQTEADRLDVAMQSVKLKCGNDVNHPACRALAAAVTERSESAMQEIRTQLEKLQSLSTPGKLSAFTKEVNSIKAAISQRSLHDQFIANSLLDAELDKISDLPKVPGNSRLQMESKAARQDEVAWQPPIDPPPQQRAVYVISHEVLQGIDNYLSPVDEKPQPPEVRAKALVDYLTKEAKRGQQPKADLFDVAMQTVKLNCGNNRALPAWQALKLALPEEFQKKYELEEAQHKPRAPEGPAAAVQAATPKLGFQNLKELLKNLGRMGNEVTPATLHTFKLGVVGIKKAIARMTENERREANGLLDEKLDRISECPNVERNSTLQRSIRDLKTAEG
jgi:hypothetical protein